jgi:peptidoglycan hydrolase CwlO-like protein
LATTAAVVKTINNQAQDATYTNTVTNNSNVTANTLNGAIANLDKAIGNRTLTSSNSNINAGMATSLSAGLQAAGNAIGSLNYSSTNYVRSGSDLTTTISALDNQLYQLNNSYNDLNEEVRDMNKEMKAGFASVAALSGLQPNARAFNDTQISVGVGNYRGQTGFALGGFHYVNDNLMMNVGAAYAGDHSATFRGGLTFGW